MSRIVDVTQDWHELRKGLITSSRFGEIVRTSKPHVLSRIAREIREPVARTFTPFACEIGLQQEEIARKKYEGESGCEIVSGKMFVDGCLAATPDGVIISDDEKRVLEIKTIVDFSIPPKTICEVARARQSRFYCDPSNLVLKKSHKYYYQVLGQMALTGLSVCDFVIFNPALDELHVQKVNFDKKLWLTVREKLLFFYSNYVCESKI